MDGYEFLKQLARIEDLKRNDTSVILLNSASYLKEEPNVKKFSIVGYIEKPVMPETLVGIVRKKYKPF